VLFSIEESACSHKRTRAFVNILSDLGEASVCLMIEAIGLSEVIAHMPMLGAVDELLLEAFIAQKLVPRLWKGACVILDNCSIHWDNPVVELI
jgi:hypothetical protein